jgi:hypothetical protein
MSKILDRSGLGAAITSAQNDSNLSSLSGINEAVTGTTYTVTIDDQNRTLEFSNASSIAVTLTAIATIAAALHTDDFKVTLKNIGAGVVTVTRGSTDTFDDGSTTQTINRYEAITIQTDSTVAKWNVFNHPKYQTTSTAGTVEASKAVVVDSNKDISTFRNIGLSGSILDANNNELITVTSTTNALNNIGIVNEATGNYPVIRAVGEAFIGITFKDSDGDSLLTLTPRTGTVVNYVAIQPHTSGNIPAIYQSGADDVGLDIEGVILHNGAIKPQVTAGDTVIYRVVGSGDTATLETVYMVPTTTHYVHQRVLPIRCIANGTIRIKLEHFTDNIASTSSVRIIKNENATPVVEWTTTSTSPVARSQDVTVAIGDVICIQQKSSSAVYESNIQNCTVCASTLTAAVC